MSQQAKIAAALTRAGITKPEAWSAAGVPYETIAVEEKVPPAPRFVDNSAHDEAQQPKPSDFNLTPPVVLMKGANNSTFVISFRSAPSARRSIVPTCPTRMPSAAATSA